MNLAIDSAAIEAAMNASATKALSDALGSFGMQKAIGGILSEEILHGAVAGAVRKAVAQIDGDALAAALAGELQKAAVKAATTLLNEGLVDIVCKLRGIGLYGDEVAKRAAVKAELLGAQ